MDSSSQNPHSQKIAGLKVVFRTMPKDLETLGAKQPLVKKEVLIKKEAPSQIPVPPKPPAIEKIKPKEEAKIFYQEGKSLYQRRFYQEAIEKFESALAIKPSSWPVESLWDLYGPWLIRWYLNSARKKLIKSQEKFLKAKIEAEEKARKEAEERLKIEEKTKKEAEERLRKEEEKRKLEEELRLEKERLKKEEEARKKVEEELRLKREERLKIEERIRLEEAARKKIEELKPGFLDSLSIWLKNFLSLRLAKNIGLILLLLLLLVGLIYWLGLKELKPKSVPSKPSPPSLTETVLPTPLFPVDGTDQMMILKIGQEKNLFQELQKFSEKEQKPGSFLRILVKIKNQEEKYASLTDLFQALEINIPQDILTNLENNYTLFSYWQKELPTNPFWLGLGKNRLGLVIVLSKKEGVSSQFVLWEEKMEEDLEPLFLGKKIFFGPKNKFQDGAYKNIQIRYLNLPDQFLSLNYGFYNNKLIITTSAESIKALIERMVPD